MRELKLTSSDRVLAVVAHPDDMEYAACSLASVHELGSVEQREYRIIRGDGEVRWLSDKCFVSPSKLFGGQSAIPGNIIVRQRGTQWWPGQNVGMGRDHTLFALTDGQISFRKGLKGRTYISVLPANLEAAE